MAAQVVHRRYAELAHGFELSRNSRRRPAVDRGLRATAPKRPGFIAREVAFLKRLTRRQVKATLRRRACSANGSGRRQSAAAYPKREDFVRAACDSDPGGSSYFRDEGVAVVQRSSYPPPPAILIRQIREAPARSTMRRAAGIVVASTNR